MSNRKKGIAAGASAMAAAVALIIASSGSVIEGSYEIETVNPYESVVQIAVPEEFKPDIAALKLNDMEVTKTLLPDGAFFTYPLVVSEPEYLSVDLYIRGEMAATAEFEEDGRLKIRLNEAAEEYIEEDSADAE